ncbi:Fanconi anemia group F protein [Phodopus roborovskii]|uniref:Fanconi anemia group F protein n=1 Tax=Phodopus roborovskii TaxID=109678 RepID=A0AAV0ABL8_PHORO|nr:Fanconi anemia group F protein [Phodopus roborovskii]CAH7459127.1 Fancf [Phodopus roborovskii]
MEPLVQHMQRFSQVLAVSRGAEVRSWDATTVRRALQWARYLLHVYRRFAARGRAREALERRLQARAGPPGLRSFAALECGDARLALRLLRNRALAPAAARALPSLLFPGPAADARDDAPQPRLVLLARRGSALHLLLRLGGHAPRAALLRTHAELLRARLRELPGAEPTARRELLEALWTRGPREHVLSVAAEALLRAADLGLAGGGADEPAAAEETAELLRWLLDSPEVLAAFCRQLPAVRLASLASCHPALSRAYLGLLASWAVQLHYDLRKGSWVPVQPEDMTWEELCLRLQSLCQAPPPMQEEVLETLRASKALDGDFEVPGISIWTDLLLALPGAA